MGRPIHPKYFKETVDNNGEVIDDTRFSVIAKIGINRVTKDGVIIRQRGNTSFMVEDKKGNRGVCKLVNKRKPEDDEMVLVGYVNGTDETVNIRKLSDRTMLDFDNNRYKWELQNDSSKNSLILYKI